MFSALNDPKNPTAYFGAPAIALIALKEAGGNNRLVTICMAGVVLETGRRLFQFSQHDKKPEESLAQRTLRTLGAAAGVTIAVAALYCGVAEGVSAWNERQEENPPRHLEPIVVPPEREEPVAAAALSQPPLPEIHLDDGSFWAEAISISAVGRDGECDGQTVLQKVRGSKHLPPGIDFRPELLESYLRGGNCSASSLRFARQVFDQCSPDVSQETLRDCLRSVMENYRYPDKNLRDVQSAYDCVEVTELLPRRDHVESKVQALANQYDLKIEKRFPEEIPPPNERVPVERNLSELGAYLEDTETKDPNLEIFAFRTIRPNDMVRRYEDWGHTTILVLSKKEDVAAYYQPAAEGGLFIGRRSDPRLLPALEEGLKADAAEYRLSNHRIFKISPREDESKTL